LSTLDYPECQTARTFAERFPSDVAATFSRRTARLDSIVHHLGLALGGRPAATCAKSEAQLLFDAEPHPERRGRDVVEKQSAPSHSCPCCGWRPTRFVRSGIGGRGTRRVAAVQQELDAFLTRFRATLAAVDATSVAGMTQFPCIPYFD
jgi:hypothetical protein